MDASLEIRRADMGFAAAHFSVINGVSERLHGHNYRVRLRVHGPVRDDGTVLDFGLLKRILRAECAQLDERVLLPTASSTVSVVARAEEVEVREGARRFLFPAGDVCLLDIPNTTCECLAAHLLKALRLQLGEGPIRLEIGVDESPGQGATVTG
ncbi:MAG: 6-pyruvoyl tetrahydropterin synthase family protein [Candidatus Dormibacteria bacterium]